jgi:hypothetical protein
MLPILGKRGQNVKRNHNHLNNLKPFEKGNKAAIGHGRPKGKSLSSVLAEAMQKDITLSNKNGVKETKSTVEWIVSMMIKNALKGDFRYFKEIYDRLEGKPIQSIVSEERIELDLSTLSDEQLDRQIDRMTNN